MLQPCIISGQEYDGEDKEQRLPWKKLKTEPTKEKSQYIQPHDYKVELNFMFAILYRMDHI